MITRFYTISLLALIAIIAVLPLGIQSLRGNVIPVTGRQPISYSKDVQPILESRCILCHGIQYKRDRLNLRTYESVMIGSKNGPVIVPGDAENSLLIQKIRKGDMPQRGPKLFPAQLKILIQWIDEGALDN